MAFRNDEFVITFTLHRGDEVYVLFTSNQIYSHIDIVHTIDMQCNIATIHSGCVHWSDDGIHTRIDSHYKIELITVPNSLGHIQQMWPDWSSLFFVRYPFPYLFKTYIHNMQPMVHTVFYVYMQVIFCSFLFTDRNFLWRILDFPRRSILCIQL